MRLRRLAGWLLGVGLLVGLTPVSASDVVTFEALTVADTAVGITATIINPAGGPQLNTCSGRLATAQIRFRFDGTAPTASVGTLLEVGDTILITTHEDADRIRFIRTGGTSGVLSLHCWR